jgi:dihydroorotate dehydrogenase
VIGLLDSLALPLLRLLEAEHAHYLAVQGLKCLPQTRPVPSDTGLPVHAFGLAFPNPVGLAAGFDKNAEVPDAMLGLGFGFVEIGTVTPLAQPGNPRPRLFRLPHDQGVINRLGFNSQGAETVLGRLKARARRGGIVGVNVGANKDSSDRIADYVRQVEIFAPVASYFTANISSPNTPGLRDLQQGRIFDELLARVVEARDRAQHGKQRLPVLVKIAPDLTLSELDDVVSAARRRRVDGIVIGNTTLTRPPTLHDRSIAREEGGLSGRPLFGLSTRMLAETFVRAEGAFPLVGVGGIDSGPTAVAKIRAGATLLQVYSALVFRGLRLVADVKSALTHAAASSPHRRIEDLVGLDAAGLTAEPWPT